MSDDDVFKKKPNAFVFAHGLVKTIAILVGGFGTMVAFMSLVGVVTGNGYVRLVVAALLTIGIPAFLADRLLPKDDPLRAIGLPTDVVALFFLGLTFLYVVLLHAGTQSLLLREADRERLAGWVAPSRVVYFFAATYPVPAPSLSTSAAPPGHVPSARPSTSGSR
jgi:serine protease Do